jgi:predicted metal-dependent TIM-barrel fold hydrolase
MFDTHLHFEYLNDEDLMAMSMAGITGVVAAIYYPHEGVQISNQTLEDLYERLFKFEMMRASRNRIDMYIGLGINMISVPQGYERLLEKLPALIKSNPSVVAVGEIGIEPSSLTLPDLKKQEELFIRQLEIAKAFKFPVMCHTPNPEAQKLTFTKKILDLAEKHAFPLDKMIVEHASSASVEMIRSRGAWAGITVQPWRGVTPSDISEIIMKVGVEKLLVNSDYSFKFSDALTVPKTAFFLRNAGMDASKIQKLLVENPKQVFNLR